MLAVGRSLTLCARLIANTSLIDVVSHDDECALHTRSVIRWLDNPGRDKLLERVRVGTQRLGDCAGAPDAHTTIRTSQSASSLDEWMDTTRMISALYRVAPVS
jgi:hypothetical protein